MTLQQNRRLFYLLRRTVSVGGTSAYILLHTGIFTNSVTSTSVSSTVYVLLGWALITFMRDSYKRATAKDNPNIGQLARATAMKKSTPWVILIIVALAIYVGISNVMQHLLVISSLQIGANVFYGFELKYDISEKRGVTDNVVVDT